MNTFNRIAITLALILAVLVLAPSATAQVILSTTTLGAAITSSTCPIITIQLASTSTMQGLGTQGNPNTIIYLDKEMDYVNTVVDSTHVTVKRCQGIGASAIPTTHANGAIVWFANTTGANPAGLIGFKNGQPFSEVSGSCTSNLIIGLPLIYEFSGDRFDCLGSLWVQTYPEVPALASATVTIPAGVLTPTGTVMITDTGTNAMTGIAVPNGAGPGFTVTFIPGGAFTTTTATNIGIASTAVTGKALIMTWNGTKWSPSY